MKKYLTYSPIFVIIFLVAVWMVGISNGVSSSNYQCRSYRPGIISVFSGYNAAYRYGCDLKIALDKAY